MIICHNKCIETIGPPLLHPAVKTSNANLSNGLWTSLKFGESCKLIREWKCSTLNLQKNHEQRILSSISFISFTSLQVLSLSHNLIETIEPLLTINLLSLKSLDISNNRINTVLSLRKINAPALQSLNLEANQIHEIGLALSEADFPRLTNFSLDYYFFQQPVSQSLVFLNKHNARDPSEFYVDSSKRILQRKVIKTIIKKFPNVSIGNLQDESSEGEKEDSQFSEEEDSNFGSKQTPGTIMPI